MAKFYVLISFAFLLFYSCTKTAEVKRQQLFLKGNIAMEENDFDRAIFYYSQILNQNDSVAEAYNNRAIAFEKIGELQKALNDYEKALILKPDYYEVYFNRAKLWQEIENYQNALRDLESVETQYKDSSSYFFMKGLIYTGLKDYQGAEDEFQKAKELNPQNVEIDINLATLFYYQKKYNQAMEVLNGVEKAIDQPELCNLKSLLFAKNDEFDSAMYFINQAIRIKANPYYYNNRGFIYIMSGQLEKGIQDIDQSILMDPDNPWAFRNKGIYYFLTEDFFKAREYLETSLQMDSTTQSTHYYLGLVNQKLGNREEACFFLQKAISFSEEEAGKVYSQLCQNQ